MVERIEVGEKVDCLPELRLGHPSLVFIPRKEVGVVFYEPKEVPRGLGTTDVFSLRGEELNFRKLERVDYVSPCFSPESPGNYLGVKGGFSFEVRKFSHAAGYALSVYKNPFQQGFAGHLWAQDGGAEVVELELRDKVYINVFSRVVEGGVVLIPVFGQSFEHPKGILATTSQVLMEDSWRRVQGIVKGLCSK